MHGTITYASVILLESQYEFVATRLLVLPSTDATHVGHWQIAPLPVLSSTMRISLDYAVA